MRFHRDLFFDLNIVVCIIHCMQGQQRLFSPMHNIVCGPSLKKISTQFCGPKKAPPPILYSNLQNLMLMCILLQAIENGRNLVALSCSIKLVNAIVSAEKRETPITDVRELINSELL